MPGAQVQGQRQRCAGPALLGLKEEEGATGQGMQAASRDGKGRDWDSPREPPRGSAALPTRGFGPRKPTSDSGLQN